MRHCRTLLLALLCAAACGGDDDPADVSGNYSVALVNRQNGCNLAGWTEGATASDVPLTIAQDGATVTGTIGGVAQIFLVALLGGSDFSGEVDGDALALSHEGTRTFSNGNCAYTYNAVIEAELDGDILAGEIQYRAATNGGSDCGALTGCVSAQEFNANRPPR